MGLDGLAVRQQGIAPRQALLLLVERDGAELLDTDMSGGDATHGADTSGGNCARQRNAW
ncbi:hypothetical protein D3C72_2531120 [compost metagenome]